MIAYHGLHDGEAEAGALLFGGVVRREEARAFLGRQPLAGVAHFDAHVAFAFGAAERECAARGHGVQSIEDEILESAVQRSGSASISGNGSVRRNSVAMAGLPRAVNCGSNSFTALRRASFTFTRENRGAGIFEKSLKRPTIVFRLASSAFSVAVDSWKTSRNCLASSWRAR